MMSNFSGVGRQKMAGVVEHDLHLGVGQRRVVLARELIGRANDAGLYLADHDSFHLGIESQGPAVMPAPRPTTSTDSGFGCNRPDRWPIRRSVRKSFGLLVASTRPETWKLL